MPDILKFMSKEIKRIVRFRRGERSQILLESMLNCDGKHQTSYQR